METSKIKISIYITSGFILSATLLFLFVPLPFMLKMYITTFPLFACIFYSFMNIFSFKSRPLCRKVTAITIFILLGLSCAMTFTSNFYFCFEVEDLSAFLAFPVLDLLCLIIQFIICMFIVSIIVDSESAAIIFRGIPDADLYKKRVKAEIITMLLFLLPLISTRILLKLSEYRTQIILLFVLICFLLGFVEAVIFNVSIRQRIKYFIFPNFMLVAPGIFIGFLLHARIPNELGVWFGLVTSGFSFCVASLLYILARSGIQMGAGILKIPQDTPDNIDE